MGDISIRESIRWLPDPPSEPTSTIVLTSPERRFVDIRILKPPGQQPGASVSDESPNIPLSRLDWAISGNSSSEPRVDPSTGEKYSHCEWRHWISSRTVDTENATDEGDNYSVEGNPSLTLEKGRMMNPQTGRVTEYEEVWRSGEILPCQSLGDDGDAKEHEAVCLVLQYQGDESDGKVRRGTVIRLGRWCQAFARIGDDLVVERWEWVDEEGKTGWEKKVVISADKGIEVPTEFAMMVGQEEGVSVEDEVVCGANGERWVVVEKSSC